MSVKARKEKANGIRNEVSELSFIEEVHIPTPFDSNSIHFNEVVADEIKFSPTIKAEDCHFIKITELGFDEKMPRREALENVIATMKDSAFNFVYLLTGTNHGIELHLGVVKDYIKHNDGRFHAYDYGELLRESFIGNFHGSNVTDITTENDLESHIFNKLKLNKRGSIITGIPSINEASEEKDFYIQKLDNLVNSMSGIEGQWQLMIVCDAMPLVEKNKLKSALFDIYDEVHLVSKSTVQQSVGTNESSSVSLGKGSNKGETTGTNKSDTKGTNKSSNGSSSSSGSSDSHTKGVNTGITKGSSESENKTQSEGTTTGHSSSREHIDKEYQALLQYMDEELFERINIGLVKGLFRTSVYALAENSLCHQRLVSNLTAMWQGDTSSFSPLRVTELPQGVNADILGVLSHFQSFTTKNNIGEQLALILGHPHDQTSIDMRTFLTSRELSLICSLPSKEVPGLSLRKAVEFGLNPKQVSDQDAINLGSVVYQGNELSANGFTINKAMLSRHVFIAGVTGSGKTTTCRRLLTESQLPFLIIEPAKTEYRSLLNEIDDMQVYTLGNENYAPFRFNPFELMRGESITSHVDLLKAAFTAAFPMEAAMPYLLEEAIYQCYQDYGWNTDGWLEECDANIYSDDPWAEQGKYWPTLDNLLKNMTAVVKSKNFDQRLESDYIASLVARFKNLTVGSKGQMLNCRVSTDITKLLDGKVVLELDDLKSPEDKCLMMGLVIARFAEAIKLRFIQQPDFKHITLMEEAHRLLEKPSPADDGSRSHAVGMFTDLLAEVRKYGESLVIVDQIPNKLAPEVLKNTNTKIIHKLFARDDREAIGDTVGLDDEQKAHLPNLRIGEVVAYSGDWNKAIHAKIHRVDSDDKFTEKELIELVKQRGIKQMLASVKRYVPELAGSDIEFNEQSLITYQRNKRKFWQGFNRLINKAKQEKKNDKNPDDLTVEAVKMVIEQIPELTRFDNCQLSARLIISDMMLKVGHDQDPGLPRLLKIVADDAFLSCNESFNDKIYEEDITGQDLMKNLIEIINV